MADDLREIQDLSKSLGPKRIKTPQVEAEQFDPITVIRAANLLVSRKKRVSMSSMDVDIATPKGNPPCSRTCKD